MFADYNKNWYLERKILYEYESNSGIVIVTQDSKGW